MKNLESEVNALIKMCTILFKNVFLNRKAYIFSLLFF